MPKPKTDPPIERTVQLQEFKGMALRSDLFSLTEESKGFKVQVTINARPSHVYFELKQTAKGGRERTLSFDLAAFAQQLAIDFHEGRL